MTATSPKQDKARRVTTPSLKVLRGLALWTALIVGSLLFASSALAAPPTATTEPADTLHHTSAVLHGHLDPGTEAITACHFDWGTDTSYSGGSVPCDQGQSFNSAADVSATLGFLTDGVTYHFRLTLTGSVSGALHGADQSFTPPGFPTIHDSLGTFGSDGTDASSFSGLSGLAFNQSARSLYAVAPSSGSVYGFNASNPLNFPPLAGFNPLSIPQFGAGFGNTAGIAVDSSSGHVYVAPFPDGVDEKQQVTVSATSGTFNLTFNGQTTPDLPYNIPANGGTGPTGSVNNALGALPSISGVGGHVFVGGGPGNAGGSQPYVIFFFQGVGHADLPQVACANGATPLAGGAGCSATTITQGKPDEISGYDSSGNPLGGNFPIAISGDSIATKFGLAVDSAGHIWALDELAGKVLEFSSAGAPLGSVDISAQIGSKGTQALAVDADDNLYVSTASTTGGGAPGPGEGVWRYSAASGYTAATKLYDRSVDAIAIDPASGHIYLAPRAAITNSDGDASTEVRELDRAGNLLGEFARDIVPNPQFPDQTANLAGLAVDGSGGDVYVSDPSDGKILVFGPDIPQELPTLTAEPPTDVGPYVATLNAKVDPETHQVTDCHFDYVTDVQFQLDHFASAQTEPCDPDPGSGSGDVAVSVTPTLEAGTTYHFRIVASNSIGTSKGPEQTFTTPGPRLSSPFVAPIGDTTATVHATVDPTGADTTCAFEYGTDTSYPQSAPCSPASQPATDEVQAVRVNATAGQFRLSFDGAQTGDLAFDATAADVENALNALSSIGGAGGSVTVSGGPGDAVGSSPYQITFGGSLGGREVSLLSGSNGAAPLSGGTGNTGVSVTVASSPKVEVKAQLTNLDPATTYHFRLTATNSVATSHTPDATFNTYGSPQSFPSCPNDQYRSGPSAALPDCRAYERATPQGKNGSDVGGDIFHTAASVSGDGVIWQSFGGAPGADGAEEVRIYLSRRGADEWSTQGTLLPPSYGLFGTNRGFTPDLAYSFDTFSLADAPRDFGLFARSSADGSATQLAPYTHFSGGNGTGYQFAGASADDSKLFFEAQVPGGALPVDAGPEPTTDKDNLYLYDRTTGQLSVAGVLPESEGGSAPAGGSFAGPYNWWGAGTDPASLNEGGAASGAYTQDMHAISSGGDKAFFSAGGTGQIYERTGLETESPETVKISASQASAPDPNGTKAARFLAATPSGSLALFASCQKLTDDSTAVSTGAKVCSTASQGEDLYAYDTQTDQLSDLTVDHADAMGAGVQGVLGASADGSYVYFAANGVLASNTGAHGETASPGDCHSNVPSQRFVSYTGTCNLYLAHAGATSFIARLDVAGGSRGDGADWLPSGEFHVVDGAGGSYLNTARVSTDGKTLLFRSQLRQSAYDNQGIPELYRYNTEAGLACVSCNPTGVAPTGRPTLNSIVPYLFDWNGFVGTNSRVLSADGSKVFFETSEKLVAADVNGDQGCPPYPNAGVDTCQDVYEWEAPGADAHGCTTTSPAYSPQDGGCLYLISSGKGPYPAFLADASATGDDVFFFTRDQLVPGDGDGIQDVYDARVGGGLAAQHASSPPPCEVNSGACQGPGTGAPDTPGAGTGPFQGPGNPPISRCPQGKVRREGRCVVRRHHKKKHKTKHHKRADHHRRAHR
jgi:hypothetical protein